MNLRTTGLWVYRSVTNFSSGIFYITVFSLMENEFVIYQSIFRFIIEEVIK